jgi:hypothetical protein
LVSKLSAEPASIKTSYSVDCWTVSAEVSTTMAVSVATASATSEMTIFRARALLHLHPNLRQFRVHL